MSTRMFLDNLVKLISYFQIIVFIITLTQQGTSSQHSFFFFFFLLIVVTVNQSLGFLYS
jgi:hypothetical protein